MLRMTTIQTDPHTTTLFLEGRIVGSWVEELTRECEQKLSQAERIILDVSQVSFVDDNGVEVLKNLRQNRVHLTGCSLFLDELLK